MNKFKPILINDMWTETKDYLFITFGLLLYSLGWAGFLIPNKITTGGVTGISAIIYYATDIPIQNTYVVINVILLVFALKILGLKFCIKTIYGIAVLYLLLWYLQLIIVDDQGNALSLVGDEPFMACIIGAALCGLGLGIAFTHNGSTGGTDIIAAIVNKYKDVTFGRMTMMCDICIISSSSFIPGYTIEKVIFGYTTLIIIGLCIDYVVNNARQSVQFFIFSKEYEKISDAIVHQANRGVTVLDGTGWYSRQPVKVIVVMAKRRESVDIFRLVKAVDPHAFISQSAVIGVYGEGFDKLKVK